MAPAAAVVVADVEMVVVNVGIADIAHDDGVAVAAVDIPAAGVVIVMTVVS